ncbi:MAG: hypothetical protein LC798_21940 [Chloroflexi bacterium]|nr:hypothetical protein [Chloroflexota bacterium]
MSAARADFEELRAAYFKVPAGEPSTERLLDAMPRLLRAVNVILDRYGGLYHALDNAQRRGYPIHVATRSTCQEHIEAGDHERDNFGFGADR